MVNFFFTKINHGELNFYKFDIETNFDFISGGSISEHFSTDKSLVQ